MEIKSAIFVKGIVGDDEILNDKLPKIAFVGRSNVGKSSLINALTHTKISRTSSYPGSTQQINAFLINKLFYLLDLPGYGFARGSKLGREKMGDLIHSYLFNPHYIQKKVVLVIDANVGFTDKDLSMLEDLKSFPKEFFIAASKIDKIKKSEYAKKLRELQEVAGPYPILPFSSTKKTGLKAVMNAIWE